ncbi:family 1 glycosylhydrolase [Ferroplasma sp.]|uniref:family 1 glycosylhydrolase n=1 Tax=Ferroplasma sp. TaxID=2591003 RepID=UPI00307D99BB
MLRKFPEDFMFGTATSPFQVEMGKSRDSISPESDWYQWSHNDDIIKKTYVSGDFPDNGPDFWNNYREFIEYCIEMGNNSIRIGIDWARIFKKSTEKVNAIIKKNENGDIYQMDFSENFIAQMDSIADLGAVEHYKKIMEYIKLKKLKIVLTAYHWPLPLWLHDAVKCNEDISKCNKKGWVDRSTVGEFGKYIYYIWYKFNNYVDVWHTINEPNIIAINGYLYGNLEGFPPGLSDYQLTVEVMRNLAYAHNIAYKIIKRNDKHAYVGISMAMPYFEPELDTEENNFIVNYVKYIFYGLQLNSSLYGNFDNSLSGIFNESRPEEFAGTDFIGIDYYSRITVRYINNDNIDIRYRFAFLPCKKCSDNYWDIYPEGIRFVSTEIFNQYRKPLIILENGIADSKGILRKDFIEKHLIELHRTIKDGHIPVKGYFHWSLMDNYEWARGYKDKFGLYTLKDEKFEKTEASEFYSTVCHNNGVEDKDYRDY